MSTLMGQLQARIETAVNKTGTYNEALQNLADAFGAPPSETGSRLIPVVKVFDPTIDNATAAQNYLLYNSTVVAGGIPAMALNFTSSESLDSRITFSRASNATVVNSDGLVSYAPHNLLTNSESFEASAWTKAQSSVTANATVAPDGTTTADLWTPTTTGQVNNTRLVTTIGSATIGVPYSVSVYVKASGKRWAYLAAPAALTSVHNCWFDLQNGVVGTQGSGVTSASIVSVGNGWYRLSTSSIAESTNNYLLLSTPDENGSVNVTADGTGLFVWGAQLNQGPLQSYYFTTPKNLLGYTQEFDNAGWTKIAATVTANTTTAPDGTTTADKLQEDATTSQHFTFASISKAASSITYTSSCYLKASERTFAQIFLHDAAGNGYLTIADLSSGTTTSATLAGTGWSGGVSTIQNVGNGWYRVTLSAASNTATSVEFRINVLQSATPSQSYAGSAGSGIFVWGAQASNSASLDPYVYNPGAAPTSSAYYGPRFDYDHVSRAPKGLLIEEQRTNLLTYSEQFENAAWTKVLATISSNVTVAPNGTTTADLWVPDNAAVDARLSNQAVRADATYSLSFYVKSSGVTAFRTDVLGRVPTERTLRVDWSLLGNGSFSINTGGGFGGASISSVGNGWFRCVVTYTKAGTATELETRIFGNDQIFVPDGVSGLFIWGAQLEAGSFATSYIPTVASQVTRSADNASMIGDNFANWYNATEGTVLVTASASASTSGYSGVVWFNDQTSNRGLSITKTSNTYSVYQRGTDNVLKIIDFYTYLGGSEVSLASSYTSAALNAAADGSLATEVAISQLYVPNRLTIGYQNAAGGAGYSNGHIRRIMYYNTRLTDAQLQALTS